MEDYPTPRLVVSRCLGFDSCRYNDQLINDQLIRQLVDYIEPITPCPEVDIGLGVPRFPVRIVEQDDQLRLMQSDSELDCTEKFLDFCKRFLDDLGPVDGFLLKHRSPSCGQKEVKIYPSLGKVAPLRSGTGLFASELQKRHPFIPLEDEGRLKNYRIRYRFYTKIFTLARYRQVKQSGDMNQLVEFQARHKFLLMAYNEGRMRELGRIAANQEKIPFETLAENYQNNLFKAVSGQSSRKTNINVLMHMFGYFSETNNRREKSYFLETLELYREGRIPLSSVISIIHSWALRDANDYLLDQYYLAPFPAELLELKDSGRRLDI